MRLIECTISLCSTERSAGTGKQFVTSASESDPTPEVSWKIKRESDTYCQSPKPTCLIIYLMTWRGKFHTGLCAVPPRRSVSDWLLWSPDSTPPYLSAFCGVFLSAINRLWQVEKKNKKNKTPTRDDVRIRKWEGCAAEGSTDTTQKVCLTPPGHVLSGWFQIENILSTFLFFFFGGMFHPDFPLVAIIAW